MNEQGIAWMVAGGHHDPSPEELRYRALRRALSETRPARPTLRERIAAAFGAAPTTRPAADCVVAGCAA
jgi:hypothetical protein